MLNKKLLDNSILLGANVEDSLLFHWLKKFHELRMGPHDEITSRLRTDIKPMSCEIGYFFENRNFSKYLYNTVATGSETFIDLMDKNVIGRFGNEQLLYVSNNDRKSVLDQKRNVKKISIHSHGLNDYRDYKAMYFSAALNRTPKHLKVLKNLGFDMEQIRTAESHEITYQSVMRTSLRNESCDDLVRLVVPDKSTAERLVLLIEGSHMIQIGDLDKYRKSLVPLTSSQKNHRVISRRIRTSMVSPKSIPFSSIKGFGTDIGKSNNIGEQLKTCYVTTHEQTNRITKEDCSEIQMNIQEWIKRLRTMSREIVDSKDQIKLYCPSIFKSKPDQKSLKCHACFVEASFSVLDFDNGKVSREDFINVFASKESPSGRRSFVITNSFNRSEEQPNRFRVIMFFQQPARTVDQYKACFDYVVRRLAKAGFPSQTSGLDRNSRKPIQSYYLPATNRAHQEWAFFVNYETKTKELERYAIDPQKIWATQPTKVQVCEPKMTISTASQQKARGAADALKVLIMGKDEGRNDDQYLLAVELKKSGASDARIEEEIRECLGPGPITEKKIRYDLASLDQWPKRH